MILDTPKLFVVFTGYIVLSLFVGMPVYANVCEKEKTNPIKVVAGQIESVWGQSLAAFCINGKTLDKLENTAEFTNLSVGDEVCVNMTNPDNKIVLALNSGSLEIPASGKQPCYTVTEENAKGKSSAPQPPGKIKTAATRGKKTCEHPKLLKERKSTSVPLLTLSKPNLVAKLLADKKELHLTWFGIEQNYEVQVLKEDGTEWRKQTAPASTSITLTGNKLSPGIYTVKIKGNKTGEVKTPLKFQVVTDKPHPEIQQVLDSSLSDGGKKTSIAMWLASAGEEWLFEAYQWVSAIPEDKYNSLTCVVKRDIKLKNNW